MDVSCRLRSIDQPEAARAALLSVRARVVGIGVSQLHVIECIQEIGAELQILPFGEVDILARPRSVSVYPAPVTGPWAGQLPKEYGVATPFIGSVRRLRKSRSAHPLIALEGTSSEAFLASKDRLRSAVWTRSAPAGVRAIGGIVNGQRKAAVNGNDRRSRSSRPPLHRRPGSCWRQTFCPCQQAAHKSRRRTGYF